MGRYLAQRLAGAIPTLLGVSVLTFAFIRLIPGDAIAARLGTSTALTPEQLASLRAYFGLDQPLPVQFSARQSVNVQSDTRKITKPAWPQKRVMTR